MMYLSKGVRVPSNDAGLFCVGDPLAACVHEATAFLVKCSTTTGGVDTLYICLPGLEEETDVS